MSKRLRGSVAAVSSPPGSPFAVTAASASRPPAPECRLRWPRRQSTLCQLSWLRLAVAVSPFCAAGIAGLVVPCVLFTLLGWLRAVLERTAATAARASIAHATQPFWIRQPTKFSGA
jgi:hypothetical protein